MESLDSLYRCPNCKSGNLTRHFHVGPLVFLDNMPRDGGNVTCKKCDTRVPWLNWRGYGISSKQWKMNWVDFPWFRPR